MSSIKEINLELGHPYVDQAIKRLEFEIMSARRSKLAVMKIIHGYGSSGKGGRIKTETRKFLSSLQSSGKIKCYIPGDSFSIFDQDTRNAFNVCSELRNDRDLDAHNNGVTFVVF